MSEWIIPEVSFEAGYRWSTTGYVASRGRLVRLIFKRIVAVISTTPELWMSTLKLNETPRFPSACLLSMLLLATSLGVESVVHLVWQSNNLDRRFVSSQSYQLSGLVQKLDLFSKFCSATLLDTCISHALI